MSAIPSPLSDQTSPVQLGGVLSVQTATALRDTLLACCDFASPAVDLSRIADVDTMGLQLMLSAQKYADERGKILRIENASETFVSWAKDCGFTLTEAGELRPSL
jgi:anti-anti-sigma regulatory factor